MPCPEPSQATRREVTRKVSGGGIMGGRIARAAATFNAIPNVFRDKLSN
jgi:3-hydroxyacyl-CoA dehydrogenase